MTKAFSIETPRLILRNWKDSDIDQFIELNRNPQVMEFFPKLLTPQESVAFADRIKQELETSGYGLYAVETKAENRFIGYTGLHKFVFDVDFAPGIEIGWRLNPDFWNQGFATEAAKACLLHASKELHFNKIYSFTAVINKRSERVMQKLEMTRVKEFIHPALPDNHPLSLHVLYGKELAPEGFTE